MAEAQRHTANARRILTEALEHMEQGEPLPRVVADLVLSLNQAIHALEALAAEPPPSIDHGPQEGKA